LSLLGKAFTSRRELEAELEKALADLRDLESNLKSQVKAIEVARAELERDQRNLEQLDYFLREVVTAPIVIMRDYVAAKSGIVETSERIRAAERQYNASKAVVKTLKARLEHGQAQAAVMLNQLKALGRVIPWTKPTR